MDKALEKEVPFLREAIQVSIKNVQENNGGPFGAVIVKAGKIIARGANKVTAKNDPTAHAEVEAIRQACDVLGSFDLSGCDIYASCEPCPMCLGAIYWSRVDHLYFAATKEDAAEIGFDDAFIYEEIGKSFQSRSLFTRHFLRDEALAAFNLWNESSAKTPY
jgi:tRNA(Arg) A34 adenosine deaminase TadA